MSVNVALFVRMEAKPGKEDDVADLLRGGLEIVQGEPATTTWFAIQLGPSTFGTFDAFPDDFKTLRTAFPDLNIAVEHMVADDDNVAIAYTVTGAHKGDFMGVPASGEPVSVRGMQIARFENGLIAERWGSSDELGILKQIGAAPGAAG